MFSIKAYTRHFTVKNRTHYSTFHMLNIKHLEMYYLVKLLLLLLRTWKSSASNSASTIWLPSLKPRPSPTWTTTCWRTLLAKQVVMGPSKTELEHEQSRLRAGHDLWISFTRTRQCSMVCESARQDVLVLDKPLHRLFEAALSQNNKKCICGFVDSWLGWPLYSTVQRSQAHKTK